MLNKFLDALEQRDRYILVWVDPIEVRYVMKLVNLTPHKITLQVKQGYVYTIDMPPSGQVARVKTEQEFSHIIETWEWPYSENCPTEEPVKIMIPVYKTIYGEVEGVPEPKEGTIYIVSSLVKQQLPDRYDVVAPDTGPSAVREGGQVVAITRFQI